MSTKQFILNKSCSGNLLVTELLEAKVEKESADCCMKTNSN